MLIFHDPSPDVVVVVAAVGFARCFGPQAPDFRLTGIQTKRVVKVKEGEFGVSGFHRLEGILILLGTHLLATEGEEPVPHAGSQRIDEGNSLSTRLRDELVLHDLRSDHEDDLASADVVVVTAECRAEEWNVPEKGNLTVLDGRLFLEQTTEN